MCIIVWNNKYITLCRYSNIYRYRIITYTNGTCLPIILMVSLFLLWNKRISTTRRLHIILDHELPYPSIVQHCKVHTTPRKQRSNNHQNVIIICCCVLIELVQVLSVYTYTHAYTHTHTHIYLYIFTWPDGLWKQIFDMPKAFLLDMINKSD